MTSKKKTKLKGGEGLICPLPPLILSSALPSLKKLKMEPGNEIKDYTPFFNGITKVWVVFLSIILYFLYFKGRIFWSSGQYKRVKGLKFGEESIPRSTYSHAMWPKGKFLP